MVVLIYIFGFGFLFFLICNAIASWIGNNDAKLESYSDFRRSNEDEIDRIVRESTIKYERQKRENEARRFLSILSERGEVYYIDVRVAGGWYRSEDAKSVHRKLKPGDKVSLRQDKTNSYDDYAVKVIANRYFIGYIECGSTETYVALEVKLVDKAIVTRNDGYPKDVDGLYIRIFFKPEANSDSTFIHYFVPVDEDYEKFNIQRP